MGADAIQVHPTPPGFWGSPKLDEDRISTFKEAAAKYGHPPFYFHAVYLINLAGDDPTMRSRSESTLTGYLKSADELGVNGVIFHTGSHKGAGFEERLPSILEHLRKVLERADPTTARRPMSLARSMSSTRLWASKMSTPSTATIPSPASAPTAIGTQTSAPAKSGRTDFVRCCTSRGSPRCHSSSRSLEPATARMPSRLPCSAAWPRASSLRASLPVVPHRRIPWRPHRREPRQVPGPDS